MSRSSTRAGRERPSGEETGNDEGDGARNDPLRGHQGVPTVPRPSVSEHRTWRWGVAEHHRRSAHPRRLLGRRHGLVSGAWRAGDRRGGCGAGRRDLVLLQPPLHERAAGASGRPTVAGRGAGDGADPVRVRWFRGERDRPAARAAVPRGAGRDGPLAGDLARAGLPRVHDGNAGAERPPHAPGAVHPVPRGPSAPPAIDVAVRSERPGCAPAAGRPPGRSRAGDDRSLLLRARERGSAARILATGGFLARPGRAAEGPRVPDLPRRGGHRDGTHRDLARRPSAADPARHRGHREGPRRGIRAARRGLLHARGLRRDRSRLARIRPRAHLGRRPGILRRRLGGGRPSGRTGPRGTRPRTRTEAPRRARGGARGLRDRTRGPRPRVLAGRGARGPAGRRVVPAGRARRGGPRGRHRAGARAPRHVDPSAGGWVRRGPDTHRPRVRELGRRAGRDGRSFRRHHRRRGARDRGLPAEARMSRGEPSGEEFVLLGIPDVNGSIRGKALRPDAFEAAVEYGTVMTDLILGLDPVDTPIADYERFGIRTGAADLIVHPEVDTLRDLAWRPGWRVCLATPSWPDGSPCDFATREVLRRVLADVEELGYEVLAAIEYEIRIWDAQERPTSSGISYSLSEIGGYDGFIDELVRAVEGLGIELSAVHTEAGPGLLELNLGAARGLAAADQAALLKFGVKRLAASLGLRASFLAKTAPGEEGSSGHVHLSCWHGATNAFAAEGREAPLPPVFASAIAGVLEHLPAASLLLNPTINSYKRLVPGWFAPINATWGYDNRSCAVRAIRSDRPNLWRFECRRPGADANPYLALAAIGASAADGIRNGAGPPEPVVGDAYAAALPELPSSLGSALHAFETDDVLREALGKDFSDYYATSRRWELKAWRETVTDWERARYDRSV